jgi:hypothetical protein
MRGESKHKGEEFTSSPFSASLDLCDRCLANPELPDAIKLLPDVGKTSMFDFPGVRRILVRMRDLFAHDHNDIATNPGKIDCTLVIRLMSPRRFCAASAATTRGSLADGSYTSPTRGSFSDTNTAAPNTTVWVFCPKNRADPNQVFLTTVKAGYCDRGVIFTIPLICHSSTLAFPLSPGIKSSISFFFSFWRPR